MANRIGYQNYYSGRPRNPQFDTIEKAAPVIADVPIGGETGQVLAKKSADDLDLEWVTPEEPEPSAEVQSFPMFVAGELEVGASVFGFVAPFDMTITEVQVAVEVAPTGADLILDINDNGDTIYTTQANRPTIAIGDNTNVVELPDAIEIGKGEMITLDVDQVGSTLTGENLMVTITGEETVFEGL
jgi:hypothetical protein